MGEAARENDAFRRFLELPPASTRTRCFQLDRPL
jgi:hypothetical protein